MSAPLRKFSMSQLAEIRVKIEKHLREANYPLEPSFHVASSVQVLPEPPPSDDHSEWFSSMLSGEAAKTVIKEECITDECCDSVDVYIEHNPSEQLNVVECNQEEEEAKTQSEPSVHVVSLKEIFDGQSAIAHPLREDDSDGEEIHVDDVSCYEEDQQNSKNEGSEPMLETYFVPCDASRTREVDLTSDLDSEVEVNERKRKRVTCPPGKKSDDELNSSNKRCLIEIPSRPTSHSRLFTSPQSTSKRNIKSPGPINESKQSAPRTLSPISESVHSGATEQSELSQLKANQDLLRKELEEYQQESATWALAINAKLDRVLELLEGKVSGQGIPVENSVEEAYYSKLPLGLDDFEEFDRKLLDSSFKQKMVELLQMVGGRDLRALVANSLRKIIIDEVAETFSLTGRAFKPNLKKKAFVKTATYRLIFDICRWRHKEADPKLIREAMCDWLTQAKFRRTRKELRMLQQTEELTH